MTTQAKKFLDQKWDAINKATKLSSNINHRLFDEVSLTLSRIEGKLRFATGKVVWDKEQDQIADKHTRRVVTEAQKEVKEARKAVTEIMDELRKGTDALI